MTKHDGKRSYKNITTRNIELSRLKQIERGADTLTTAVRVKVAIVGKWKVVLTRRLSRDMGQLSSKRQS